MFSRNSKIRGMLIEGIPQMEKTIRDLSTRDLDKAMIDALAEIGHPTQRALANYFSHRVGKHDNEPLRRAMQHRWWSEKRQQGLPTGYSRALAVKLLLQDGFGFKAAKMKKAAGYFLRIKAWGEGMHLIEKGRYKGVNTYTGWKGGIQILKRFEAYALGRINTDIPKALERAAEAAARRNGVRS